jgi:N-acetylmuramoyl-L-alanine amidase
MIKKVILILVAITLPLVSFCAPTQKKKANPTSKMINATRPIILLDAGHGGFDIGAKLKFPRVEEKQITLQIAYLAKKYLDQMGYRVVLSRTKDTFIPLKRRVYMANKSNAELFISFHFNSCPNKNIHGIEIFYHGNCKNKNRVKDSKKLADVILSRMIYRTRASSRGVKNGNFCVIRDTKMPAVLIEGGFVTNNKELSKLRQRSYLDQLARGIAEGIDRYVKS